MRRVSDEVVDEIKIQILRSIYFFPLKIMAFVRYCGKYGTTDRPQMTI
jgi:hypothetical protein